MLKSKHEISFRVYYEDTDLGGIVYHANYLKFAERARTEWLRELGLEQSYLKTHGGLSFLVHHLEIAYQSPAKLDDLITIETTLEELKKASLKMKQILKREDKPLATLSVTIACVNSSGKPSPLPALLSQLRKQICL